MRHPRLYTMLLLLVLVPAPVWAQGTGVIRGSVVDITSNSPLPGAQVAVEGAGQAAVAGPDGTYLLNRVPAGTYTLTVTQLGYETGTRTRVTVREGEVATVRFELQPSAIGMEGVVVSASKTPTEIRDVPAAVEVVTVQSIERSGSKTFMDAVQNVTGLSGASYGENFQSIQLRGLPRLGNENETVLILIDGVPQTDSRNSARLAALPIDNIERIEVTKGPNSALYGRNAIGGVLNIVTKSAAPEPTFTGRVEGGDFAFARVRASASGPTGADGTGGYFVSWMADKRESFHNQPSKRHDTSVFGKLAEQLRPGTDFSVSANYATSRGGTPAPLPVRGGVSLDEIDPAFDRFTNLNLPTAGYNQDEVRVSGDLNHDLAGDFSLSGTLGYRHIRYNFVDDGDILDPPAEGSTVVTIYPFEMTQEEDHYYGEVRLAAAFGPESLRNQVVFGVSAERNDGSSAGQLLYTDPATFGVPVDYTDPQFPTRGELEEFGFGGNHYTGDFYGVYVQDEIVIRDRWHLSIGARYDVNDLFMQPADGSDPVEASFGSLSPKIGLSYRLIEGNEPGQPEVSVYAQTSRAFRPPRPPSSFRGDLPDELVPERIRNAEVGLKSTLLGGRVGVQVAAFDMTRDGIAILVRNGPFIEETNAGEQLFRGVEASVRARPITSTELFVNYAYYDGRFGDFTFIENDVEVDLTDFRVSLSPQHQVDLGGSYRHGSGVSLSLDGHYESERFLNNKNTVSLDPYFVTNGRVAWQWQNYELGVSATNLTDVEYSTDGDLRDGLFVFPAPPRRITAEFAIRF